MFDQLKKATIMATLATLTTAGFLYLIEILKWVKETYGNVPTFLLIVFLVAFVMTILYTEIDIR